MIVIIRSDASQEKIEHLKKWLTDKELIVREFQGQEQCVLGLIGNTNCVDKDMLKSLDIVESVSDMTETFKASNRKMHPDDSVVKMPFSHGGSSIGGGNFAVMAGPCSVESREQILFIAEEIKAAGANFIRGGAFKPRTSPYDFQGMGADGLGLLVEARKATGLPIVTELMDLRDIDLFMEKEVDVIQIGARNTQNYDLLKELGRMKAPILLKRGLAGTIKELLMSAEYIMASGNENVILCERGIRTYEHDYTRNTLDLSAVPVLKKLTHLPVIVDPSHGTGRADLVESMALAAIAAGADGIMIEVHNDPKNALSDGPQSLTPPQFSELSEKIFALREVVKPWYV
ncbi:MAG: 3-deoxy-7-phosphoheptulonate synthase [Defluviitaleaceae bacterium]|nr:3-deoxy-7-phosphoheptulonate synthase [Defluviitaleaceae bacterium]